MTQSGPVVHGCCGSALRRVVLLCSLAGASASIASVARAQSSITVPPDAAVYRDVQRLIDDGLVDDVIVGQRPYSNRVLAEIVRQATDRLARTDGSANGRQAINRRVVARLSAVVQRTNGGAAETPFVPVQSVRVHALTTNAPSRPVPDNGLGAVEADLNTLTNNRAGRRFVRGSTIALETELGLQLWPGASIQVQPRVSAYAPSGGADAGVVGELLSAHARLVRSNVALTVGREYTLWAPAEGAGLFFSDNAPALNLVRLSSDAPFTLPSIFRHLGLLGVTMQVADLGPSTSNSHSLLVAYKLSVRPARSLELGATFENHFGGRGARNPSAVERFYDLVPFIDLFRTHADSTDFDSDKLIGFDARLRIAPLGGMTIFGEVGLEDFDYHRVSSLLTEDAAYTAGVIVPVPFAPSLTAHAQFHAVGLRFYQHHLVRNGIASRRFILGDDLGRDARSVNGGLDWQGDGPVSIRATGAWEVRRNDQYVGIYTKPDLTGFVFRKLESRPREERVLGTLGARWHGATGRVVVEALASAERATNFAFVRSDSQTHGAVEVSVTLRP